jgi:hypothetical protein
MLKLAALIKLADIPLREAKISPVADKRMKVELFS